MPFAPAIAATAGAPPATVSFPVLLPSEPVLFHSRVALDPQSWDWGGDGVTFVLTVVAEDEAVELYRHHVSNSGAGRGWHAVIVPLTSYQGKAVMLNLATEIGPVGGGVGVWTGWEQPRIMDAAPFYAGVSAK